MYTYIYICVDTYIYLCKRTRKYTQIKTPICKYKYTPIYTYVYPPRQNGARKGEAPSFFLLYCRPGKKRLHARPALYKFNSCS